MKTIRSDTELVRAFQQGDPKAFEEIDQRYRVRLVRYLSRKSLCPEMDREDRTQQIMLRVFENLKDLADGSMLAPWIYRIAVRLCIDESRKNQIPRESDLIHFDRTDQIPDPYDQRDQDPAFKAEQNEERRNLWIAAERILSEPEFQILWMFYMDEYSPEEIGKIVNKKSGTIRVLLHRARRKLAIFLQSWRY